MINDVLFHYIKEKGIKNVAKNYFSNLEEEHWVAWLKDGSVVYLNKNFIKRYPITSCFEELNGELILKDFEIQKIPRKALKKINEKK